MSYYVYELLWVEYRRRRLRLALGAVRVDLARDDAVLHDVLLLSGALGLGLGLA